MGECDQQASEVILDFFWENGGVYLKEPMGRNRPVMSGLFVELSPVFNIRKLHRYCQQLSVRRVGDLRRSVDEEAK
jgi:hypothetical protein